MTEIKPFHATCFNQQKIGDVAKVVCPPYDVISPAQQDMYHQMSEHNFIRVLLGKDQPGDNDSNNKYTRARDIFSGWLKDGILTRDEKPGIYFYRQEYRVMGERHTRMGFISLMKIQDEEGAKIFPHENTHAHAKEDRFRLWSAVNANLSPIFVCFSDRIKRVEKIFMKNVYVTKPFIDVEDVEGVKHIVWRLDDPQLIAEIQETLAGQPLFIADGHHRYEVAKQYRRVQMAKAGKVTGDEPFNYVMTYFTNIDSRDLKIFPIHRVIKHIPRSMEFLEEFFRIDRLKSRDDLIILLSRAGQNEQAFGLYTKDGTRLLRLRSKLLIDQHISEGSKEYRSLDATILKNFILDRLGIKSEDIFYTKDFSEATAMVDEGRAEASFIMNPVRIQQLKDVALNGERMPPKTTYFYPKALSGLTIYRLS